MSQRRAGGRGPEDLRPVEIVPGAVPFAEGSALIRVGETHVLCAASVEDKTPRWLAGQGRGWVTAEYSMLPRATKTRTPREAAIGRQSGRTVEIQRLIGRALRSVVDLRALGERQIIVDCDVLRADGGTRCAAITGAWVAVALAARKLLNDGKIKRDPIEQAVAAVSVGIARGAALLDLDYAEDSNAEVDFNVAMTGAHEFVEVQGTAEGRPFSSATLDELLVLASFGLDRLFTLQRRALEAAR